LNLLEFIFTNCWIWVSSSCFFSWN